MLPHTTRERHRGYQAVHVTARAVRLAPNLRSQSVFAVLRAVFARSSDLGSTHGRSRDQHHAQAANSYDAPRVRGAGIRAAVS